MTAQEFKDDELIMKIGVMKEYEGVDAANNYVVGNRELLQAFIRKNERLQKEIDRNKQFIFLIEKTCRLVPK